MVWALGLADLTGSEADSGIREALSQGVTAAVGKLGVPNGFLGNPKVKIPLPGPLKKAEKWMRMAGMGRQADDLITTMNHAAEQAVPEAKPILLDAVKGMSVEDAKALLTGGDDSVTQYFKKTTTAPLTQKFLPIVKAATDKLDVAKKYNTYAGSASQLGLLSKDQSSVEGYVTQKALDGLFLMMGEEERAIRKDPMGQSVSILRKVFGAVGH